MIDKKSNFECKLFKIFLFVSLCFWAVGSVRLIILQKEQILIGVYVSSFLLSMGLFWAVNRKINLDLLIKIYCFYWLPVFVILWKYLGGVHGPMSYVYFLTLVIYVGLLERNFRVLLVFLLCVVNVLLVTDNDAQLLLSIVPMEAVLNPLAVDYLTTSIVISFIVYFIKTSFDKERIEIETYNAQLESLNDELMMKQIELVDHKKEIRSIQNNLELIVKNRTKELEDKNLELEEYAYDNAHLVRGPLSNILGLLNILKIESDHHNIGDADLNEIMSHAGALDQMIRKINKILR